MSEMKRYGIELHFKNTSGKLYFCGPNTPEAEQRLAVATEEVVSSGDECEDFADFVAHAYKIYRKYGFTRMLP